MYTERLTPATCRAREVSQRICNVNRARRNVPRARHVYDFQRAAVHTAQHSRIYIHMYTYTEGNITPSRRAREIDARGRSSHPANLVNALLFAASATTYLYYAEVVSHIGPCLLRTEF